MTNDDGEEIFHGIGMSNRSQGKMYWDKNVEYQR